MDEYLLKIVIIGAEKVGKTSLLTRFVDDKFTECHKSTIGVDFRVKTMVTLNKIAKMQLWDTAGQERFRNIVSLFYRGAEGIVLVFDVTDARSFQKIPYWLKEATDHNQDTCVKILVGNKVDMEKRAVDRQTAEEFAAQNGMRYIETSAKTASNVHDMFGAVAEAILQRKIELGLPSLASASMEESIVIQSQDVSQASWCNWGYGYCGSE